MCGEALPRSPVFRDQFFSVQGIKECGGTLGWETETVYMDSTKIESTFVSRHMFPAVNMVS